MQIIKISEIQINKLDLMKTWEQHKVINRNINNIIEDFDYMLQAVTYNLPDTSEETMEGLSAEKLKCLNAYICGVISTISPDSKFNKYHVVCEDEVNAKKIKETSDFAKSLQI